MVDILLITMFGFALNIAITYVIVKDLDAPKLDKAVILSILWGVGIIAEVFKMVSLLVD